MIRATEHSTTCAGAKPRLPIRFLQGGATLLRRTRLLQPDFSEAAIVQAAERRVGLADWGDEGFRVPLRCMLEDARDDARLSDFGRVAVRERILRVLTNRLLIRDEWKRHPEIPQIRLAQPIFVIGFPRTGTTLLHQLLSQDPDGRPLFTWETFDVLSARDERRRVDPRIRRTRRMIRAIDWLSPELRVIHAMDAMQPEECLGLLSKTFLVPFLFDGPRYRSWLWEQNYDARVVAYRHYRQQLQALQRRCSGAHWVLKCPAHMFALDALTEVFPDACLVQTHRDPLEVVPSGCSLYTLAHGLQYKKLDASASAAIYLDTITRCVDRCIQARDSISPTRVFDLQFEQLVADPIDSVRQIYGHFGKEVSPEMQRRMHEVLKNQPRHKHGVHRYTLDQFGLNADAIARQFAGYCERFNVRSRG